MTLRPYIPEMDFPVMQNWITDERAHALWCANRFAYPLNRENVSAVLADYAQRLGEMPLIAADENGTPAGFVCYSLHPQSKEGMLKFVVVDPARRGKGTAKEMLRRVLKFAFEFTGADAVHLNVFSENPAAKACYTHLGFAERENVLDAFSFRGETWDRCNMLVRRG